MVKFIIFMIGGSTCPANWNVIIAFLKATPVKKWALLVSSAAGGAGIATGYVLDGPGFDSR